MVLGSRPRAGWIAHAGFAAVLVSAIWPRLASIRLLFARGELMQWDGDSAYHLKRILHALDHFPSLPRFDPAMNWPVGAACPWPDGFDLLAATWGLIAGLGSAERAAMAVLLFTPIVALFAVWSAMDLARLLLPEGPAREGAVAAAGLMTAVVPSAIHQSQIGFLDHHIAELLAFLLLAGWALRRLPRPGDPPRGGELRWELGGALAATFALWVFAGGVLYVAIAAAIVVVAVLRDDRPRLIGSGLPALAAAAAAAALLTLPALRAHGRILSYQFPSLLQPLLVAGAAAAIGLAVAATRFVKGFARRSAVLAGLGLGLAAVVALAFPAAVHEVRAGLEGWLLRRDPWIASVAEFQRFGWGEQPFLVALFTTYGSIGVLAPLLLIGGGWVVVRAAGVRGIAFVALSAGFVLFTLNQVRFERIGQPLLMINTAAVLAAFAQRARATGGGVAVRLFPALATIVLILADPLLHQSLSPNWFRIPPTTSVGLALRVLARDETGVGVLTSWDQGHIVSVISGLPTPTNGFGSYLDARTFERSEAAFTSDGASLDAFLQEKRLRFVVAGALSGPLTDVKGVKPFAAAGGASGGVLNLDYMKSFPLSPLIIGGSAVQGAGVSHVERLMPVFATREQVLGLAFALPSLWVYERVLGARLVGSAAPGKRIVASLDFREQGRAHTWRALADAGPTGGFELVLPFPTSMVRPGLSSSPRYTLRVDDGPATEVEVPEETVRSGGTVRVTTVSLPRR